MFYEHEQLQKLSLERLCQIAEMEGIPPSTQKNNLIAALVEKSNQRFNESIRQIAIQMEKDGYYQQGRLQRLDRIRLRQLATMEKVPVSIKTKPNLIKALLKKSADRETQILFDNGATAAAIPPPPMPVRSPSGFDFKKYKEAQDKYRETCTKNGWFFFNGAFIYNPQITQWIEKHKKMN